MTTPAFPPLMWGEAAAGSAFDHACQRARSGCDAGLVAYRLLPERLEAALVLAPEVPLGRAVAMMPLCGVGFQNALGALAPPEVAVHLEWAGGIRINGGRCGGLRMAAAHHEPEAQPDWLVIDLALPLWPEDDTGGGQTPDLTTLYAEGCAEVPAPTLLEAYARHTLAWIDRWEEAGNRALYSEWKGLVHGVGKQVALSLPDCPSAPVKGTFKGVDEDFGMLLQTADGATKSISLTALLEGTR